MSERAFLLGVCALALLCSADASAALDGDVARRSGDSSHRSAPVFSPAFFNMFDQNGDEKVSFRELTESFKQQNMFEDQAVEQADAFFEVYDRDGDGHVDFHEFSGAWKSDGAPRMGGRGNQRGGRALSPKQRLRRQMTAFYTKHNPAKLSKDEFEPLLNYFVGREDEFNAQLRKVYKVDLTSVAAETQAETGAGTGTKAGTGGGRRWGRGRVLRR